jgi:hypothetical protein
LAAYRFGGFAFTSGDEVEQITAVTASSSLLPVLGVNAALGRPFTDDEERRRERVVVLTHEFWQRRFGADAGVVGRG